MIASLGASAAVAQTAVVGESYIPTIWVDPDGCEHWVMDDGHEGYMSAHLTRDGLPVCNRGNTCGIMDSDQLFATNQYAISSEGRRRLEQFFKTQKARAYIIAGHTDSRASDAYNMTLSRNRANEVAKIARGTGANIQQVVAYGERKPRATNKTAAGMAQNRRVEIICVR